jgi:hypothetical protein
MKTASKLLVGLGFAAAVATVGAKDAKAYASCGMGDSDWLWVNERANVARAEELLDEGKTEEAAWLIQQTWPTMNGAIPTADSMPQIAEGVRIMAIASVRLDGKVKTGMGFASRTPLEQKVTRDWGLSRLRMLVAVKPDSNAAQTDLGEALARAPETRDEAKTILEALNVKGAIATPEGYAALALVRSESGETNSAETAMSVCVSKARYAITQCATPNLTATNVVVASR